MLNPIWLCSGRTAVLDARRDFGDDLRRAIMDSFVLDSGTLAARVTTTSRRFFLL
jgi:hypothetical protein